MYGVCVAAFGLGLLASVPVWLHSVWHARQYLQTKVSGKNSRADGFRSSIKYRAVGGPGPIYIYIYIYLWHPFSSGQFFPRLVSFLGGLISLIRGRLWVTQPHTSHKCICICTYIYVCTHIYICYLRVDPKLDSKSNHKAIPMSL